MDKKKIIREIRSWGLPILIALAVVLVFNSKVMAKRYVSGGSMENTLFHEQQVLINKFSYNFREPSRGEIITFLDGEKKGTLIDDSKEVFYKFIKKDELHTRLVKRVIGIEGDVIDIKEGYVYVNGEMIDEAYVKGNTYVDIIQFPLVVDEGKLFVLGDNREGSSDSRDFGLIECNQVEGKVFLRVYPFDKMSKVK